MKLVVLGIVVKRSKQSTLPPPPPPIEGVGGGGYQTGSLLITIFLCFSSDADEMDMEEAWKKQAETMVSGLEKVGTLKSIIDLACQESEKIPSDFGRGGKEGMATFVKIMQGKGGGVQGEPSFRRSLESLLSASEGLTSALEQELVRCFPLQLSWNRKEGEHGPPIKILANRVAFAIGEILRRFEQPST